MSFELCVTLQGAINLSTWKLNVAESKNLPSDDKNTTIAIAAAGESVKVTEDGREANGKPWHDEWIGKFDRKDYPVTGDPGNDTGVQIGQLSHPGDNREEGRKNCRSWSRSLFCGREDPYRHGYRD